ncbi:MAG: hypothetical protein J3K34DRAFT_527425 [Monoraphidium minutum]|nr:MAG: hypothetical protein J3K34DRAFT_527425 [Monoraphidium minutum]
MGRGRKRLPTDEIDMLFWQVYDGLELPTEDDDEAAQEFEHIYNAQWRDFKASTKVNYTSYLRRWIEYVKEQQLSDPSFTAVVHPVAKAARFLRHLLETRFVGAKDPAGAVDNIRKALGHLRNVQRGIPDPSTFSKHPLIAAVSSEAHKRRAEVDLMEAVGARLVFETPVWQVFVQQVFSSHEELLGRQDGLLMQAAPALAQSLQRIEAGIRRMSPPPAGPPPRAAPLGRDGHAGVAPALAPPLAAAVGAPPAVVSARAVVPAARAASPVRGGGWDEVYADMGAAQEDQGAPLAGMGAAGAAARTAGGAAARGGGAAARTAGRGAARGGGAAAGTHDAPAAAASAAAAGASVRAPFGAAASGGAGDPRVAGARAHAPKGAAPAGDTATRSASPPRGAPRAARAASLAASPACPTVAPPAPAVRKRSALFAGVGGALQSLVHTASEMAARAVRAVSPPAAEHAGESAARAASCAAAAREAGAPAVDALHRFAPHGGEPSRGGAAAPETGGGAAGAEGGAEAAAAPAGLAQPVALAAAPGGGGAARSPKRRKLLAAAPIFGTNGVRTVHDAWREWTGDFSQAGPACGPGCGLAAGASGAGSGSPACGSGALVGNWPLPHDEYAAAKPENQPGNMGAGPRPDPTLSAEEMVGESSFVCERVCTSDRLLRRLGKLAKARAWGGARATALSRDPTPNSCITVCGVSAHDACVEACQRSVCSIPHQVPAWNEACLKRCTSECLKGRAATSGAGGHAPHASGGDGFFGGLMSKLASGLQVGRVKRPHARQIEAQAQQVRLYLLLQRQLEIAAEVEPPSGSAAAPGPLTAYARLMEVTNANGAIAHAAAAAFAKGASSAAVFRAGSNEGPFKSREAAVEFVGYFASKSAALTYQGRGRYYLEDVATLLLGAAPGARDDAGGAGGASGAAGGGGRSEALLRLALEVAAGRYGGALPPRGALPKAGGFFAAENIGVAMQDAAIAWHAVSSAYDANLLGPPPRGTVDALLAWWAAAPCALAPPPPSGFGSGAFARAAKTLLEYTVTNAACLEWYRCAWDAAEGRPIDAAHLVEMARALAYAEDPQLSIDIDEELKPMLGGFEIWALSQALAILTHAKHGARLLSRGGGGGGGGLPSGAAPPDCDELAGRVEVLLATLLAPESEVQESMMRAATHNDVAAPLVTLDALCRRAARRGAGLAEWRRARGDTAGALEAARRGLVVWYNIRRHHLDAWTHFTRQRATHAFFSTWVDVWGLAAEGCDVASLVAEDASIWAHREYQRLVQLFMAVQLEAGGTAHLGQEDAWRATLAAVNAQAWAPPGVQMSPELIVPRYLWETSITLAQAAVDKSEGGPDALGLGNAHYILANGGLGPGSDPWWQARGRQPGTGAAYPLAEASIADRATPSNAARLARPTAAAGTLGEDATRAVRDFLSQEPELAAQHSIACYDATTTHGNSLEAMLTGSPWRAPARAAGSRAGRNVPTARLAAVYGQLALFINIMRSNLERLGDLDYSLFFWAALQFADARLATREELDADELAVALTFKAVGATLLGSVDDAVAACREARAAFGRTSSADEGRRPKGRAPKAAIGVGMILDMLSKVMTLRHGKHARLYAAAPLLDEEEELYAAALRDDPALVRGLLGRPASAGSLELTRLLILHAVPALADELELRKDVPGLRQIMVAFGRGCRALGVRASTPWLEGRVMSILDARVEGAVTMAVEAIAALAPQPLPAPAAALARRVMRAACDPRAEDPLWASTEVNLGRVRAAVARWDDGAERGEFEAVLREGVDAGLLAQAGGGGGGQEAPEQRMAALLVGMGVAPSSGVCEQLVTGAAGGSGGTERLRRAAALGAAAAEALAEAACALRQAAVGLEAIEAAGGALSDGQERGLLRQTAAAACSAADWGAAARALRALAGAAGQQEASSAASEAVEAAAKAGQLDAALEFLALAEEWAAAAAEEGPQEGQQPPRRLSNSAAASLLAAVAADKARREGLVGMYDRLGAPPPRGLVASVQQALVRGYLQQRRPAAAVAVVHGLEGAAARQLDLLGVLSEAWPQEAAAAEEGSESSAEAAAAAQQALQLCLDLAGGAALRNALTRLVAASAGAGDAASAAAVLPAEQLAQMLLDDVAAGRLQEAADLAAQAEAAGRDLPAAAWRQLLPTFEQRRVAKRAAPADLLAAARLELAAHTALLRGFEGGLEGGGGGLEGAALGSALLAASEVPVLASLLLAAVRAAEAAPLGVRARDAAALANGWGALEGAAVRTRRALALACAAAVAANPDGWLQLPSSGGGGGAPQREARTAALQAALLACACAEEWGAAAELWVQFRAAQGQAELGSGVLEAALAAGHAEGVTAGVGAPASVIARAQELSPRGTEWAPAWPSPAAWEAFCCHHPSVVDTSSGGGAARRAVALLLKLADFRQLPAAAVTGCARALGRVPGTPDEAAQAGERLLAACQAQHGGAGAAPKGAGAAPRAPLPGAAAVAAVMDLQGAAGGAATAAALLVGVLAGTVPLAEAGGGDGAAAPGGGGGGGGGAPEGGAAPEALQVVAAAAVRQLAAAAAPEAAAHVLDALAACGVAAVTEPGLRAAVLAAAERGGAAEAALAARLGEDELFEALMGEGGGAPLALVGAAPAPAAAVDRARLEAVAGELLAAAAG